MNQNDIIRRAADVVPNERQLLWHELEFYGFCHFGINTFTNREWGYGNEDPKLFNPTQLDARQWVAAAKDAGMRGLLLTCKHHDGFCLWPSAYTEHCVKNSPWKNGKGDVVKEVSDACREAGLKFGVYLSPWDRHEPTYGSEKTYDDYFCNQLRELLTNYGEIFCAWFDGACGEGPNGKKQVYDWERYFALIHELQPNAVTSICGEDVRWIGNEAGVCRESEWSVVPAVLQDRNRIAEESQHADDPEFAKRMMKTTNSDLGSRAAIAGAKELIWFPAEVDTSIRPGWFYHKKQDRKVRKLKKLLKIYDNSVGANGALLLNIPPDTRGLFSDADVKRLHELGEAIRARFAHPVRGGWQVQATSCADSEHTADKAFDGDQLTYWKTADNAENVELTVDFGKEEEIACAVLREQIRVGQHVEAFKLSYWTGKKWKEAYAATVIGAKRICLFKRPVRTRKLRLTIDRTRIFTALSTVEFYH